MSLSTESITSLLESQASLTVRKSLFSASSHVDNETAAGLLGLLNSSGGSLSATDVLSFLGYSDDSVELTANSLSNLFAMDSLVSLLDSGDSEDTSAISDLLSSGYDDYESSLYEYIADNPDLALIAQANASSSSVLDIFS